MASATRGLLGLLAAVLLPAVAAAQPSALVKAYQKEFAFLEAEQEALQKRIAALDGETGRKVGALKAGLETIQETLLAHRAEAERLEDALLDAERETARAEEHADLLAETLDRASESLQRAGFDLPAVPEEPRARSEFVAQVFGNGIELLERSRRVRTSTGPFFLEDGTRTEGTLIHVGEVATYGISDRGTGALIPVGGGRLRLWHQDAAASALGLQAGAPPATLGLFLYESLDKAIEQRKEKTVEEIIQSGGIIAWVIVGLGGVAALMILARLLILWLAGSRTEVLLERVGRMISAGLREEALAYCTPRRGAASRVLAATIRNLDRDREHLEDIVSEAILHEAPFIERFGSTITVIAAVAPLLGLLGTVTGIISTFDVITEFGTGDPKLLSAGISEALVTTELGLIVAIPTLLLGTLLSGRATIIEGNMERAALRILNLSQGLGARTSTRPAAASSAERDAEAETEPDAPSEPDAKAAVPAASKAGSA